MNREPVRSTRGVLAWSLPLVLAVAWRVGYLARVYEPPSTWLGDPLVYRLTAEGLLRGELIPEAFIWPPGYPLLGALLSFLGGPGFALVIVSVLGGISIPVLALWAGIKCGLPRVGLFASILLATDPALVDSSGRALSESPQIALLILAAVGAEGARRTGRSWMAVGAGAAGGLSVLARSESSVALLLLIGALLYGGGESSGAGRRPPTGRQRARLAALLTIAAAVIVLPYVLALHSAAGVWGLSLKPHYNILKIAHFSEDVDYLDARDRWDHQLATYETEGELDPRKLAAAVSTRDRFLTSRAFRAYADHWIDAFDKTSWSRRIFWILGLAGLTWVRPTERRARWIAAIVASPVLLVPLLFPPSGRYAISAIPGLAWGIASLAARAEESWRARRPSLGVALAPLSALALTVSAWRSLSRDLADFHWSPREFEIAAALHRGDLDRAEAVVRTGLAIDADDPRFHDSLGLIRDRRDDTPGAEAAFRRAVRLGGSPVHLATILVRTGRFQEAASLLTELRGNPPDDGEYWSVEGALAFRDGRWEDAAGFLARAERIGGANPQLSLNRGVVLGKLGRLEEATVQLRRAAAGADPHVRRKALEELERLSSAGRE